MSHGENSVGRELFFHVINNSDFHTGKTMPTYKSLAKRIDRDGFVKVGGGVSRALKSLVVAAAKSYAADYGGTAKMFDSEDRAFALEKVSENFNNWYIHSWPHMRPKKKTIGKKPKTRLQKMAAYAGTHASRTAEREDNPAKPSRKLKKANFILRVVRDGRELFVLGPDVTPGVVQVTPRKTNAKPFVTEAAAKKFFIEFRDALTRDPKIEVIEIVKK